MVGYAHEYGHGMLDNPHHCPVYDGILCAGHHRSNLQQDWESAVLAGQDMGMAPYEDKPGEDPDRGYG